MGSLDSHQSALGTRRRPKSALAARVRSLYPFGAEKERDSGLSYSDRWKSERASDTFGNQRPGTWPAARRTEVRAWHGCWAVSGVDEEAGRALGEPDCGVSVNKHTIPLLSRHLSLRRRDPTDTTQHSLTHSRWGCPPGWPPGGPGRRGTGRGWHSGPASGHTSGHRLELAKNTNFSETN